MPTNTLIPGNYEEPFLQQLINKKYYTVNHPRIGELRSQWKAVYKLDLDNKVHPMLFRILCAFLDQGIAIDGFPVVNKPFIESIKELEQNSFVSFFKTKAEALSFYPATIPLPHC